MKNKERLTTSHCGKAVIKDKNKLSVAMEKLAEFEEKEKCGEWRVLLKLLNEVEEMKNREKYEKELACNESDIAVSKATGNPIYCNNIKCDCCALYKGGIYNDYTCVGALEKWAESEYIEKPVIVISKRDRAFLEYLSVNIQYIARDMSGRLYIYVRKPYKQIDCWSSSACETEKTLWMFNIDFPMIKWSDEEPWLIEDLKKLEVVDSYE
mgnify:CR=1 FL=1